MIDERGARHRGLLNVRAISYSNPPVDGRDEVEADIAHARIRQLRDFSRT